MNWKRRQEKMIQNKSVTNIPETNSSTLAWNFDNITKTSQKQNGWMMVWNIYLQISIGFWMVLSGGFQGSRVALLSSGSRPPWSTASTPGDFGGKISQEKRKSPRNNRKTHRKAWVFFEKQFIFWYVCFFFNTNTSSISKKRYGDLFYWHALWKSVFRDTFGACEWGNQPK